MGGALALVDDADVGMAALRERVVTVYDRLLADEDAPDTDTETVDGAGPEPGGADRAGADR